jgi:hypothetical protein
MKLKQMHESIFDTDEPLPDEDKFGPVGVLNVVLALSRDDWANVSRGDPVNGIRFPRRALQYMGSQLRIASADDTINAVGVSHNDTGELTIIKFECLDSDTAYVVASALMNPKNQRAEDGALGKFSPL